MAVTKLTCNTMKNLKLSHMESCSRRKMKTKTDSRYKTFPT